MKRRSAQGRSRRSRKSSLAPYSKYDKRPYSYSFPTGQDSHQHRSPEERDRWLRAHFADAGRIISVARGHKQRPLLVDAQ